MRGSSVTERAWGVSGWARMREMRKREALSCCAFRIPHIHVHKHKHTFLCDMRYVHMHFLQLAHSYTRHKMYLYAHRVHTVYLFLPPSFHTRTQKCAQSVEKRSQCRRHMVPLTAHTFITQSRAWQNPLPHRPWVHTYTPAHIRLYTLTHTQR